MESGKRSVVFRRAEAAPSQLVDVKLPCGQCVGCRLEYSRQWAMRCIDEASLYNDNSFITLTYDDDHLPNGGSLNVEEWQLFAKRLRKRYGKFRFFHAGEYGEIFGRPHYHALLFGCGFADRVFFKVTGSGSKVYTSSFLSSVWGKGHCSVGDVTFESAAYVARYCMKKVTGAAADDHYVNKVSGEVLRPEYVTMSRRPGIGRGWYDKFKLDMYPSDNRIINGMKVLPPRYYDGLYELEQPLAFRKIKANRVSRVDLLDNDSFRLPVKEEVKIASIRTLSSSLED